MMSPDKQSLKLVELLVEEQNRQVGSVSVSSEFTALPPALSSALKND